MILDTQKLALLTIEYLGGVEPANKIIDEELGGMSKRWDQDVEAIGRILRSHLYVEHYLTEYLRKANPRLGDISVIRSFSQKVKLLDSNDPHINYLIVGINHLNTIRNRIAHNLDIRITDDDIRIFLSAFPLQEFHAQSDKKDVPLTPLQILEEFSTHAAHALTQQFSEFSQAFTKALHTLTPSQSNNSNNKIKDSYENPKGED